MGFMLTFKNVSYCLEVIPSSSASAAISDKRFPENGQGTAQQLCNAQDLGVKSATGA